MKVQVKAYGRQRSACISKAVGEIRLRAMSESEAKLLTGLSRLLERPLLLGVMLELSDATIESRVTDSERKTIAKVIDKASRRKTKAGKA